MFRKTFFLTCLVYSALTAANAVPKQSGWLLMGKGCTGAKGDSYNEMTHPGPNHFIAGVRLRHTSGYVGCDIYRRGNSNWGCERNTAHFGRTSLGMVVTDADNQILYPAPRLAPLNPNGWYKLPGFTSLSPQLVLSDFGNPVYLTKGAKIRIWYGEDYRDTSEHDNHGNTCYDVDLYVI